MKECNRCVLTENDDPEITIDNIGLCNYCNHYDKQFLSLGTDFHKNAFIEKKIKEVKLNGINKKYDCLIGLSGGLDSSYMAYWLALKGVRPLVVHLDNGWNSELAAHNIKNICQKLNFDLYTHVINWEEFKEMQLAYLRASVVDIEVLTDHAIKAIILQLSKKFKIKYVFSGFNISTEAIMVKGWTYKKDDFINIKDIVSKHSPSFKFKTYPFISFRKNLFYNFFLKSETINLLDYISYNKDKSKDVLMSKLNWKDYGGKHYESLFTKFYQAYILPRKFNIDKRRVHLSNLICSNQLSKSEAVDILKTPLYKNNLELNEDLEFIVKKLGISFEEFNLIMSNNPKKHSDYKTYDRYWKLYFRFVGILKLFYKK